MKKRDVRSRSQKSQAAMEFLMTYGWALLVVLVAIGSLAFFGVFRSSGMLPDQCTMFAGFSCTSYYASLSANQIKLTFQNGLGYAMNFDDANGVAPGVLGIDVIIIDSSIAQPASTAGANDCTIALPGNLDGGFASMANGGAVTCGYKASGVAPGTKVKATITVTWKDPVGNVRTRTGNLVFSVES